MNMAHGEALAASARRKALPVIFVHALGAAAAGIAAAVLLFPSSAATVGVFLFVIAQTTAVGGLLDRNRDQIWDGSVRPRRANAELVWALATVFAAVLLVYGATSLVAAPEQVLRWFDLQLAGYEGGVIDRLRFGPFGHLARHNGAVIAVCFLFALFYGHGGMLLVLAWNASLWGAVLGYVARASGDGGATDTLGALGRVAVSILPHLLLEAVAYVLMAMAGVFLHRALRRYEAGSARFRRVAVAAASLAALGVVVLLVAAAVEAHAAPWLIRATGS